MSVSLKQMCRENVVAYATDNDSINYGKNVSIREVKELFRFA
jgi:hypothetical protein